MLATVCLQWLLNFEQSLINQVPSDLTSLFSRNTDHPLGYNLRNRNYFVTLPRRTTLFANSFVPSAIDSWNSLPEQLRNSPSIGSFKRELSYSFFQTTEVPSYYCNGSRVNFILHARLRNNSSDLFLNHVSKTNKCELCNESKDVEHYFFKCLKYNVQHVQLFRSTHSIHPLNSNLLLYGDPQYSLEQNISIVAAVYQYIQFTKRFNKLPIGGTETIQIPTTTLLQLFFRYTFHIVSYKSTYSLICEQ